MFQPECKSEETGPLQGHLIRYFSKKPIRFIKDIAGVKTIFYR
jgi:hypothetical protein